MNGATNNGRGAGRRRRRSRAHSPVRLMETRGYGSRLSRRRALRREARRTGAQAPRKIHNAASTAFVTSAVPSRPPNSNGLRPPANALSTARLDARRGLAPRPDDRVSRPSQSSIMRGRQQHRGRVRLALPHDVRRGAVARLEHRMRVADVGRRRHAHAADETRGEIGQDVAEHVLGDQHVEIPRPAHQRGAGRVDVGVVRRRAGLQLRRARRRSRGRRRKRGTRSPCRRRCRRPCRPWLCAWRRA